MTAIAYHGLQHVRTGHVQLQVPIAAAEVTSDGDEIGGTPAGHTFRSRDEIWSAHHLAPERAVTALVRRDGTGISAGWPKCLDAPAESSRRPVDAVDGDADS